MTSPLVFNVNDAIRLACSSRSSFYNAVNSGALTIVKRGVKTLVTAEALQKWIDELPQVAIKSPTVGTPATTASLARH